MVFSSKSRSPYTQMFLTHIDEHGNDTPAILVENNTAANRAVNIPEFVNIPPDGLQHIDAPVTEYFQLIDDASEAMNGGDHAKAIPLLKKALAQEPSDPMVHNSYGTALAVTGRHEEAIAEYRRAIALSPDYPDAYNNLGSALVQKGRTDEAIAQFEKAIALKPDFGEARAGLGSLLAGTGRAAAAVPHLQRAVELNPEHPGVLANLALALSLSNRSAEAIPVAQKAVALTSGQDPRVLELLGRLYAQSGRLSEAIEATRQALDVASRAGDEPLVRSLQSTLSSYRAATEGAPRAPTRISSH
jgi:Flp pilus assembly protein TadD